MSNGRSDQNKQPLHVWLPGVVLKFLVFLAFAFVLLLLAAAALVVLAAAALVVVALAMVSSFRTRG